MTLSPYVTVREAGHILGIPEGKVMQMVEGKKLMAYRIGGQYLRLKRSDIQLLRDSGSVASENVKFQYTAKEKLRDFFAYNDFYIVSFVVVILLLSVVLFSK